jgi:hypothetical protein
VVIQDLKAAIDELLATGVAAATVSSFTRSTRAQVRFEVAAAMHQPRGCRP